MCSLQRVSLLEPFPPKINVRKLRRSHSAPFKLSSCHTFMPYLDDIGIGKEAIKAVVTSNEDKGCIFNEELSDQVHLVRNQIHDALRMSRSEKSKKPKPRAVLYRRRYRRTALPEQQELKSVELADRSLDCAVLDSRQPENLECAVLDSRHPENPQPEIQYDNLPISPSTDQEVQTSSCNECCREMRCSRCPVMMDSSTESLITVSHIQIQCQADYQDSEAQCCTIGCADSTMQTDIAELCQQSMQTESALHSEDSSTQTVRIESFGQAVQCSVAREQMETQTVNTFADSMVQCTESDIGKLTTSGSKLQQDFSDLNQHVDQFIRSISPGRSTLQERQKRQYIDLIEDPDKGVLVLDDGRSLKVAGPMGPRSLVSLNVGGQRFDVLRSTLARYPETLLGRIANSPLPVYIDRSPTLFPLIIDTYRTGSAYVATAYQTTTFLETLRDEARFYQIEQRMFPNGIQSVYDPATHQSSTVRNLVDSAGNGSISLDKDRLSEDEEGQCNQFELFERCVLVPGMSATFTPRTNETLILDTICGKGQLLLDAEHNYRPELSIHGAVAFDSAAYLNSSEEDVFNIGTTYPHGASYTFFMLDMQHKRAGEQESTIDEDISCDFCGLLQHTDPGIGRMPICTACHSRLPDKESQAGRRTPSGFNSSTKVEKREQLTITMRIVCTFDKKCRAKVSTLKKGNVTVISKAAIEAKQHAPRGKSPAKRSKQIPSANVPEKQQPLIRQTSSASTKINKQMKPSPLPLIRRPPMV